MPWTDRQRKLFMIAARAAGWNDDQRYIAMRHSGCPTRGGKPSVTHPRNDNAAFERCMALAESCAGQRGEHVPPPSRKPTWREAVATPNERMRELATRIADEAARRLPAFGSPTSLLSDTIRHVTSGDSGELTWMHMQHADRGDRELARLDAGQLYRVVESLRAHVGRVFLEHGITPTSFTVPASARRRVAAKGGAA